MAYPEVVSKGGYKSRKCKWLVKVGVSNGVTPHDQKKIMAGGVPGNQKTPLDTPLDSRLCTMGCETQESIMFNR